MRSFFAAVERAASGRAIAAVLAAAATTPTTARTTSALGRVLPGRVTFSYLHLGTGGILGPDPPGAAGPLSSERRCHARAWHAPGTRRPYRPSSMPLDLIEFPADDLARARRFWEGLL